MSQFCKRDVSYLNLKSNIFKDFFFFFFVCTTTRESVMLIALLGAVVLFLSFFLTFFVLGVGGGDPVGFVSPFFVLIT